MHEQQIPMRYSYGGKEVVVLGCFLEWHNALTGTSTTICTSFIVVPNLKIDDVSFCKGPKSYVISKYFKIKLVPSVPSLPMYPR